MIKLYVNNQLVDLQEGENVLMQFTRTDYTNPAIVKNSFSKTVTLPGSYNNDNIFGHIYKTYTYVNKSSKFNPSKRIPFTLTRDDVIIEKGYLKLDKIINNYSSHSYECTLYGELGNILYSLSYKTDPDTGESTEMTLADLSEKASLFPATKTTVKKMWDSLLSPYEDLSDPAIDPMLRAFNFAVCYDGVPTAENFDPKKIWTDVKRTANVAVGNKDYLDSMPQDITDEGTYYGYVSTKQNGKEYDDRYGLIELQSGAQPVEVRDLRAYLLRPLIRIRYIIERIGEYIKENLGYTLDTSDFFFKTDDYINMWMTLPMLYEIQKDITSSSVILPVDLLKNTSSPASYLISFCKIFGLYINIDVDINTLTLTRTQSFFNKNTVKELIIDESNTIDIKPLSFDKSAYTFDWGESKGEFIDKYKDKYSRDYGMKRINTGWGFDADTESYIQNNIFKNTVDAIEQSGWYKYNAFTNQRNMTINGVNYKGKVFNNPVAVGADIETPSFTFYHVDETTHLPVYEDGEVGTYSMEMGLGRVISNFNRGGYMYPKGSIDASSSLWNAISTDTWQDSIPKLQFHDSSRKPIDGSNVLVKFNSYMGLASSETARYTQSKTGEVKWYKDTDVYYLLSDDEPNLKSLLGKNCYFDNPSPETTDYIEVIKQIPVFTRMGCIYDQTDIRSKYVIKDTIDFGYPREVYIPGAEIDGDKDIYTRYWKDFITDLYDVNTRILTGRTVFKNTNNAFRNFYIYNNSVWIISSSTDYNMDTGIGTFEFTKVNDKGNYGYRPGVYLSRNSICVPRDYHEYFIDYKIEGDAKITDVTSDSSWCTAIKYSSSQIRITVNGNITRSDREAVVTVNTEVNTNITPQTINVKQYYIKRVS